MPILWRYLLRSYFQFFFLCICAFVAILLVIKFQDIALFASSGANLKYIALFSLYQIPYILPLAIPISSLIAAMILFQRLSSSSELTAMRASGIGIRTLIHPLILTAFFLGLVNFSVQSEITPLTRIRAKNLIYEVAAENPLIIMQKESMLDLKTVHFDLKSLHLGKKAKDVVCVMRQDSSGRIGLFTAQEIFVDKDFIYGKALSVLSSAEAKENHGFDHLIIENQKSMQTSKSAMMGHILKTDWFSKEDLLNFRQLITQCFTCYPHIPEKIILELLRRISLGICPLTFTIIGIAFGTNIGRLKKKRSIFIAFSLSSLVMICFVASKTLHRSPFMAPFFYLLPQFFAIAVSLRALSLRARGVE
jgi:lipopolysaccharide export system permease protein